LCRSLAADGSRSAIKAEDSLGSLEAAEQRRISSLNQQLELLRTQLEGQRRQ
jgi:hypothetical protein